MTSAVAGSPVAFFLRLVVCGLLLAVAGRAAPLRVAIDAEGFPMTFVDEQGVARGFAVDLMKAVAREMQFEVDFIPGPWPALEDDFRARKFDAFANIAYSDERLGHIAFSAPHLVMPGAIFVRKGDHSIQRPSDLRERRVAVRRGGAPQAYLVARGWNQQLVLEPSTQAALHALADGHVDAVVHARVIGRKILHDEGITNVELSDVVLADFAQRLHAGFHPGDDAQVALYNEGLARLHANGTYDRLYDKWIAPLEPARVQWRQVRPYALGAALLFAGILGALAWQRRVLRRVAQQAEALRRSEERLTLVLRGTEDGFWDWNLVTNHVERSERWAEMLGYTLAEIPPTFQAGRELVHPDDRKLFDHLDVRLAAGSEERHDLEFRMRTKSGGWRWILNRGKVVRRAPDGVPLRMAGTHTDITDLRQARDEAARQEARFRVVYQHAPVGLSWMHLGRPETRLVNPAYERITGLDNAAGRSPGAYLAATHPDDRAHEIELDRRLRRGEINEAAFEKRYVHRDGRIVWAIMSIHVYRDPALGDDHKVTTLIDISDRKRNESERDALNAKMLEAQKLESLGVLAGGIAHDFNNLLTVILANATFARQEGALTEPRIAPIETAARRAADLCRQMLAYAGKGSVLLEQVALDALVRETAQLLQVSISKKARLTLDLAPGLPRIEADASQVRQIVMNLVINASDALGEAPGEIRLTLRSGRPGTDAALVLHNFDLPAGESLCLEVADTGHGMSAATINRIFDPFFTTKFTGRGLGLAAVLGIVRAHHGALAVQSELGRGTTFRLYLPASRRAVAAIPHSGHVPPAAVEPGYGTILIADDEPAVLATVDMMIRRQGYQTVLATNGDEAVQRFTAEPDRFAAVVLDLTMPGRDGAEVLAAIRAERAFSRVLVMSGFSEADIVERLRGCGDVVILRKPFTQETLLDRLKVTLAPAPHD